MVWTGLNPAATKGLATHTPAPQPQDFSQAPGVPSSQPSSGAASTPARSRGLATPAPRSAGASQAEVTPQANTHTHHTHITRTHTQTHARDTLPSKLGSARGYKGVLGPTGRDQLKQKEMSAGSLLQLWGDGAGRVWPDGFRSLPYLGEKLSSCSLYKAATETRSPAYRGGCGLGLVWFLLFFKCRGVWLASFAELITPALGSLQPLAATLASWLKCHDKL